MICPRDPPEKKNLEKLASKGLPRARTLAEFKETFPDFCFHNMQINVGTPQFRSKRQAQNTDTHVLNQLRLSQNSSPL